MSPHKEEPAPSRPVPETWQMGTAAFERRMAHHNGIEALWRTKWEFPCLKGVYPFHDGQYEDFAPIFADLAKRGIDDGYSAEYTQAFLETAKSLEAQGDHFMSRAIHEDKEDEIHRQWLVKLLGSGEDEEARRQADLRRKAKQSGECKEASALYLRAAAVLRIARFPYVTAFPEISCPVKFEAWEMQKRIYMKAAARWELPVEEVDIPHTHRAGNDRDTIPAYVRMPDAARRESLPETSTSTATAKVPTLLLFTGLDGYRPDNTVRSQEIVSRGWAIMILEIPGTADCPADSADPTSSERLWDSVFAWMDADGRFDMRRVVCWGLSSGGYYAARIAHTHADRLVGSVAQGAGTHYFFDRAWLAKADGHEYPFQLLPALAMKHGFGLDGGEEYVKVAKERFSLLDNGILEMRSCRLLLVNGTLDGLMPIEDSQLLFEYGSPKEARFFPGALHMGYPLANSAVYPWLEQVMASVGEEPGLN